MYHSREQTSWGTDVLPLIKNPVMTFATLKYKRQNILGKKFQFERFQKQSFQIGVAAN